jgi:tetratricopeptide (TPR) repeat protein/predicted Ser/Thr protein kinase
MPDVRGIEETVTGMNDGGPAPSASRPPGLPSDPAARFGRYIRVDRIGAGGGGEVWKAWDTELNRWVALKFLRIADEEEIARFKREAQVAGRLAHPNIAAVYEVGESQGRHFIAMQFIDGGTLKNRLHRDIRDRVRWLREAALAIEFAHQHGVVHRDLKPDNVMLDLSGRLFVMDFGLARQAGKASGLTSAGVAVGTPSYMSPEQARGEPADVRTDVYGLGATLYELLTKRPPFTAASVLDTLMLVIERDVLSPRAVDPSIDPDLETIVLKALEKEPSRRYASAQEVADDLGRWLDGDAISARRTSMAYRVRKKLAKKKAAVAAVAVALALLLLASGAAFWQHAERESTRRQLIEQMRLTSDASLDAALALRRAGDTDGMRDYAARVEAICRKVITELPASPEPHYRLGRIYRALMRDDDALAEQQRALAKDPACATALTERVILLFREFTRRFRDHREAHDRALTGLPRPTIADFVRIDARARDCARLIERDAARLPADDPARGLSAWVRADFSSARPILEVHAAKLEIACEALATLEDLEGRREESLAWWSRGRVNDRGYLPFVIGEATALLIKAGDSPAASLPIYERAVSILGEALDRNPHHEELLRNRGLARMNLGATLLAVRRDPVEPLTGAIRDLDEAMRLDASRALTHALRGTAKFNLAQWKNSDELYAGAVADLDEATRRDPRLLAAWGTLVSVHTTIGEGLLRRNADADAAFGAAVRVADAALTQIPSHLYLLGLRAEARFAWSKAPRADAASLLQLAESDCSEALGLDATNAAHRRRRAQVRLHRGIASMRPGGDPVPHYEAAIADCGFLETDAVARSIRASARSNWGLWEERNGRDGVDHYRASIPDFDEALRLAPQRLDALDWRAGAYLNWGTALLRRNFDGSAPFLRAIEDFTELLRLDERRGEAWTARSTTRTHLAQVRIRLGQDALPLLDAALSDATTAAKLLPRAAEPLIERGRARYVRGLCPAGAGADDLRAALRDFQAAAKLDPSAPARTRAMEEDCRRRLEE